MVTFLSIYHSKSCVKIAYFVGFLYRIHSLPYRTQHVKITLHYQHRLITHLSHKTSFMLPDEAPFTLKDVKAELNYNFILDESLARAKTKPLFQVNPLSWQLFTYLCYKKTKPLFQVNPLSWQLSVYLW